jgi:nitrogen fixation protein NifU and related proteins
MYDWTFVSQIPWLAVCLGAALMIAILASWVWFEHRVDPHRGTMDTPDATAFVRGKCGDAMKISLRFSKDRVADAKYWTDGCRMSSECGAAAARLSLHRTPEEISDIDHAAIEKEVGVLPEEDFHCATLAAGALQEALRVYLVESGPESAERLGKKSES